jgi:hypothetical protein
MLALLAAGRPEGRQAAGAAAAEVGERLARFIYGDADPLGRRFGGPDREVVAHQRLVRRELAGQIGVSARRRERVDQPEHGATQPGSPST